MTITLDYVIVGYATNQSKADRRLVLLAYSQGVPAQDISVYQQCLELSPLPIADAQRSQAIGMAPFDETTAVFARAHYQNGDTDFPVFQYVLIPYEILSGIGARLAPLQTLFNTPIPRYDNDQFVVPPLILPTITTGSLNSRVESITYLVQDYLDNNFELVMTLLGAVLNERKLIIRNFPLDITSRIRIIQGLRMLLPVSIAMRVSFSSNVTSLSDYLPQLIFSDELTESNHWKFDWDNPQVMTGVLDHPYIQLLQRLWNGDVSEFVSIIKPMDVMSHTFIEGENLNDNLLAITKRFNLDLQVAEKEEIETSAMIEALDSTSAPQGQLRYQYIRRLLQNALNNRDTVAGKRVAEELSRDSNLENSLSGIFDSMLESQPDTVYVFVRNRLNNLGIDERWIQRLQTAASSSLEVAIHDGDVQTLISWLELIAREPQSYELDDVLSEGILKAQPRAHDNGELGMRLILIATRRVPDILPQLYDDAELMNALPDQVGIALRQSSTESLESLIESDAEHFLLALFNAIQSSDEQVVTRTIFEHLWLLYANDDNANLPAIYHPLSLIRMLGTQASHQMTNNALDALLIYIIDNDDSALFVDVATHLANRDVLFPRLSDILQSERWTIEQTQAFVNWVADIDNVAPRQLIDTYFALLDFWDWPAEAQTTIESLARLLAQHPDVTIANRHLWKLFETCHSLQLDSSTRVVINQMLYQLKSMDDVALVISDISRIYKVIASNKIFIGVVNTWWRDYASSRSMVQLQRIDREMDTQRSLDAPRQIVQTAIAMRRLMGSRDLLTFAEAINTAYSVLGSITDAFDSEQLNTIDTTTIRNELDRISTDLSPDERYVLAKNLRELAQHITRMSDNRSKPSLMRSDEAIDRQLMHGEADPQGSVDVMKWIAGYLDGAHDDDE